MKRLLFAVLAIVSCVRQPTYVEGGLYSVPGEGGKFTIVKILRLEAQGVHVRVYSNAFAQRPSDVDESTLYMAGLDHKPGESPGLGHAPISRRSFATWGAQFIKVVPVRDDELNGYRMWLDAKGGFFD